MNNPIDNPNLEFNFDDTLNRLDEIPSSISIKEVLEQVISILPDLERSKDGKPDMFSPEKDLVGYFKAALQVLIDQEFQSVQIENIRRLNESLNQIDEKYINNFLGMDSSEWVCEFIELIKLHPDLARLLGSYRTNPNASIEEIMKRIDAFKKGVNINFEVVLENYRIIQSNDKVNLKKYLEDNVRSISELPLGWEDFDPASSSIYKTNILTKGKRIIDQVLAKIIE